MKIDEKTIEKMFEEWVSDSSNLTSEEVKKFREMNEQERIRFALANGFKAAINLLLPIIQKQDEAIRFYADRSVYGHSNEIESSDWDAFEISDFMVPRTIMVGGKLARSTKQEVSEMIKRLGGN